MCRFLLAFFLSSLAVSAQTLPDLGLKISNHDTPYRSVPKLQAFNMLDSSLPGGGMLPVLNATDKLSSRGANDPVVVTASPGEDIGAKVNAAVTSLGGSCGEIAIPAGNYKQATTIVVPRCISLRGVSGRGTILNYTPTSGWAIIVADGAGVGGNDYPEGAIEDLTLLGSGAATATGGIYLGGTDGVVGRSGATSSPSPAADPAGNFGDHENINRARIWGFGVGIQWGNNSWSNSIFESVITNNGTNLYYPAGLSNSGESIRITNTSIQNAAVLGINQVGFSDFYFYGDSCDYNLSCGNVLSAHFYGMHFEQTAGIILTVAGTAQPTVEIFGGAALLQAKGSASEPAMFYVNSSLNPTLTIDATYFQSNHPLTSLVKWNGSGGNPAINISNLPYHPSIPSLLSTACNFWGCNIFDNQSGLLMINSRNLSVASSGAITVAGRSLKPSLTGTTETITGTALSGTCDSGTVSVSGATIGMPVIVSSTTGTDIGGAFNVRASVTATNMVTVYVCGTGTPASLAYNVRVIQ
jgi:hypothetical protein